MAAERVGSSFCRCFYDYLGGLVLVSWLRCQGWGGLTVRTDRECLMKLAERNADRSRIPVDAAGILARFGGILYNGVSG